MRLLKYAATAVAACVALVGLGAPAEAIGIGVPPTGYFTIESRAKSPKFPTQKQYVTAGNGGLFAGLSVLNGSQPTPDRQQFLALPLEDGTYIICSRSSSEGWALSCLDSLGSRTPGTALALRPFDYLNRGQRWYFNDLGSSSGSVHNIWNADSNMVLSRAVSFDGIPTSGLVQYVSDPGWKVQEWVIKAV